MTEAKFANEFELIKIKAELLCWGIRPNDVAKTIYNKQNPCGDWKTGNVGLHISLENDSHVIVTVSHAFDNKSPYHIEYEDKDLVLIKNDKKNGRKVVKRIKEVQMPNWYQKETTTNKKMPSIFLHEGRVYLHQTYSGCDYHRMGLLCKFCGTGPSWRIGTPMEIADTVEEAFKENKDYHVCLGGGTRLPLEKNVEYFSQCAREIRKRNSNAPIWIEMVPPKTDEGIYDLIDSGATSFGFNIEIWDDKLRKEICPGKSQVSKERYLDAMKTVSDRLGPNRVGCCLLVGLEPINSSIEGARVLPSIGAQPCMLTFKPWDKSMFYDYPPTDPKYLIEVSYATANAMRENNISPESNEGCLQCEGCTLDHDIYNLLRNNGGVHL